MLLFSSPTVSGAISASVVVAGLSVVGDDIDSVDPSVVVVEPVATPVIFTLCHFDIGTGFSPLKHDILAVSSFAHSLID
jgi:hypothetical protein